MDSFPSGEPCVQTHVRKRSQRIRIGGLSFALVTLFILFSAFASSIPQDSAGSAHLSPGDQSVGFPEIAPRESLGTLPGDVENPFIAPNNSPGTIERAYTFPFSQTNVTVRANASVAVYEGARNGVTYTVAPHGSPIELLAPGYYQAFIDDAHQDPFYTGLLCDLSSIRSRYSLTDDEYLELTTNFVQSFPYDTEGGLHSDNPPRFPVQTFVDGTGDCDDKSLLLAGLLSREGYDIVLFLFIPEHHMAIGVRNSSFAFRNTGYMFIETMGPVLVGEVPSRLAIAEKYDPDNRNGNLTIANSTPLVIRVGTGTKGYTSASETAYILGARKLIDSRIAGLRPGLGNCTAESRSCKLAAEREYNRYALLHNYIVKHSYDRKGLYRYLRGYDPARTRWSLSPVPDPVYGASSPLTGLFGNNRILSWRWQDLGQQVAFLHAPSLYYNSPGFWHE